MVGIVHSVVVLLMLLFLMPLVGYIPMPSLSALLMVVAYKMINWEEIRYTIKHAPKSDAIVLIVTILTAICFDLMTSVEVGIMLTAFLFLKRMADVTTVESWKYLEEEEEDPDGIDLREVPKHTEVFEICGPMFFAASDKLLSIAPEDRCRCLILRMRSVSAIDATAMHRLEQLLEHCNRRHITLVLSHVNEQPMSVIEKSTFLDKLGKDNFCIHIDDALKRAEQVCMRRKEEIK